jgi:hypothetical protein
MEVDQVKTYKQIWEWWRVASRKEATHTIRERRKNKTNMVLRIFQKDS